MDAASFLERLTKVQTLNPTLSITTTWDEFIRFKQTNLIKKAMDELKTLRNSLLQQTDWIFTGDNIQTIANLDDWTSYRQTLREFFSSPTFQLILVAGTEKPDFAAMNFPPTQPQVIRK